MIREVQGKNVAALAEANILGLLMDTVAEAVSATVLLYDRNDELVYASVSDPTLVPIREEHLAVGTRLRDLLKALYEAGGSEFPGDGRQRKPMGCDDWVANKIASLWKERSEFVEERDGRCVRYRKRRLPNGYGVCVVQDVSDKRKRKDQVNAASERQRVMEEALDQLPFSVCIKNQDMVYIAANQAFGRLAGLPVGDILGKTPAEVFAPEVARQLESVSHHIVRSGIAVTIPQQFSTPDGNRMDGVIKHFRTGRPGCYYVVTVIEEVSARSGLAPQALLDESQNQPAAAAYGLPLQNIDKRKVLVATGCKALGAATVEVLAGLGADAAAVCDASEMDMFLAAARQASVGIDLVLLDSDLAGSCAAVAARFAVPVVVAAHDHLANGLQAHVADIFKHQTATVSSSKPSGLPSDAANVIDVLVAEDNEVNQIVFSRILEGFGYRFAIASNGEEAVALWRELSPRLVLMDITLPGVNGFEAARRIRAVEATGTGGLATPIIGVLPHPFERDRDDCFASGMNDVILKPMSPEMLEAVFSTHMHSETAKTA